MKNHQILYEGVFQKVYVRYCLNKATNYGSFNIHTNSLNTVSNVHLLTITQKPPTSVLVGNNYCVFATAAAAVGSYEENGRKCSSCISKAIRCSISSVLVGNNYCVSLLLLLLAVMKRTAVNAPAVFLKPSAALQTSVLVGNNYCVSLLLLLLAVMKRMAVNAPAVFLKLSAAPSLPVTLGWAPGSVAIATGSFVFVF